MASKKEANELTDAERYQTGMDAIARLVELGVPTAAIFPAQQYIEDFGARAANERSKEGTDGQ